MIKRILVFLLAMSALVPSLQAMNQPEPKSRMAQLATLASRHKGKIACGLLALAACCNVQGVQAGPIVLASPSDMCDAVSLYKFPDYAFNETAAQMWHNIYNNYVAQTATDSIPRMVTELWHSLSTSESYYEGEYPNGILEFFQYCYANAQKVSLARCLHG